MRLRVVLASLFLLCCLVVPPISVLAQSDVQQDDLAEAARKAREKKGTRAKRVITDDDESSIAKKTAFPELKPDGSSNTEDVVAKFKSFKGTHTPKETEAAIRDWFEQQSGRITQLVEDIRNIAEREVHRGENANPDSEVTAAEMHAVEQNKVRIREELASARHLRADLDKVLTSLKELSLAYDFKLPEIKIDGTNFE